MSISEKVAYLQGLAKGLEVDKETAEGKVLAGVLDVLSDISNNLQGLGHGMDVIAQQVDLLADDVDSLYEEEEEHEHSHGNGCGCGSANTLDDDFEDYEGDVYMVTCGNCGEEIYLVEDSLDEGEIQCPTCDEILELDFSGEIETNLLDD